MAKRDVNLYFLQVEYQYLEMLSNIKELENMRKDNLITEEEYQAQILETKKLQENYERIAYIMFELNKPNRRSKELSANESSWYRILKSSSKETILDENKDVLCTFKKLIQEKGLNKDESSTK